MASPHLPISDDSKADDGIFQTHFFCKIISFSYHKSNRLSKEDPLIGAQV